MKKRFLIISLLMFLLVPVAIMFSGCSDPDANKIKLDMSNAKWDYKDDFEIEKNVSKNFEVKVSGLPEEVSVVYSGNTAYKAGDYEATIKLVYDEEKYKLENNTLSTTLNWKVYDLFFLDEVSSYESTYSGNTSRWFGTSTRRSINYIHFVKYLDKEKIELTQQTSQSLNGKKSPSYMWGENINGEIHQYIGFDSSKYLNIKMPEDCTGYFAYMTNLKAIYGLDEYVDTKYVKNMTEMFRQTHLSLDLNFDTSNVTNMEKMFWDYGRGNKNTNLTLSFGEKFTTINVEKMTHMFAYCGYDESQTNFALYLNGNFFVNNVADMRGAFIYCGYYSTKDWSITINGTLDSNCVLIGVFSNIKKNTTIRVDEKSTYDLLNNSGTGLPSSCQIIEIE